MKKFWMVVLLIIVFSSCLIGQNFCCAEFQVQTQEDFNQIISQMQALYSQFELGEGNIITTAYYSLIKQGEDILSDEQNLAELSEQSQTEFLNLRFFYYREKAVQGIKDSYNDTSCIITFENKNFYFYIDQWDNVTAIYENYLEKAQNANQTVDFAELHAEYYAEIQALPNKEQLDEQISEYVSDAVYRMDFAIVEKINQSLTQSGLPIIEDYEVLTYRKFSENTEYFDWFNSILAKGYQTTNAIKVASIHTKAINDLENLSIYADEQKYAEIATKAIQEITNIDIVITENQYLLEACKQSAFIRLETFTVSDIYDNAKGKTKATFDSILNEAKQKITSATTISEVQNILFEYENKLADVNVGGNDWVALLVIGIVLFVVAVVLAVMLLLKRKKGINAKEHKKNIHKQRELLDKEIDMAIDNQKENKQHVDE